jgi:hypothetical protein
MRDKVEAVPWIKSMRPATRALMGYQIEVWVVAFGLANLDIEEISALGVDKLR